MKRICSIYRCSKKEGMYLYLDKTDTVESIPKPLLKQIGRTELAMTLLISEEKKLARANAKEVLASISDKGFYLQMPPGEIDTQMREVRDQNSKL